MKRLTPEAVWRMTDDEVASLLKKSELRSKKRKIRFYAPSFSYYRSRRYCTPTKSFPSISLTGVSCALNCEHCGGKLLKTMYPAETPEELFNLCVKLKADGAVGCLISGGCQLDGRLPLEKFVDAFGEIKRKLGLTLLIHTGIIDHPTAEKLGNAQIDAALIDIVGSEDTIREIFHMPISLAAYEKSLEALQEANIPTIPHVLVGVHYGRLEGEFQALQIISRYSPSAVIIIALMPIRNTRMENVEPSTPEEIAKVILASQLILQRTPVALGCMRPTGAHRDQTDCYAVKAGVNGIAFPAEKAVQLAETLGYEVSFSPECCSQIYRDAVLNYTL